MTPNPTVNADAPRRRFARLSRAGYLARWAALSRLAKQTYAVNDDERERLDNGSHAANSVFRS